MSKKVLAILLFLAVGVHFSATVPDEGMYPLSDLDRAGLQQAGLEIDLKDIYNPGQVSLVDALVRVGGCTGSFVSESGLIITNHHCAYSAVQLASTPEQDYLTHGFVADTREKEIRAQGLTIRITIGYEDVSARILGAIAGVDDPVERIRIIKEASKSIADAAVAADPAITAEVSEMFIGKSYVLFKYQTIEDVRLVYVPSQNIGEFGGETDNWEWPRHTGDYSFLRAYVAPDGSSAPYAKENVPYKPRKHLKINPQGVDEEDFVFILGYPGRTYRHRPAQYIEYQQRYLLPYVSELNDFQIQQMEAAGAADKAVELQLATRIKRNANVMKNYRGKLKGLRNINLLQTKKEEDAALANFIRNTPELEKQYGTLMTDIDALYQEIFTDAEQEMWLAQIYSSTSLLQVARNLNHLKKLLQQQQTSEQREQLFASNITAFKGYLDRIYASFNEAVDAGIFSKMLQDAWQFEGQNELQTIAALGITEAPQVATFAGNLISNTQLTDKSFVTNEVLASASAILAYNDELLQFEAALAAEIDTRIKPEQDRREGLLNRLMGDYVTVKEHFLKRDFVPDANATLRLTYGYIRGYSPADATYMKPFTTIRGLLEKGASGNPVYDYPSLIRERWEAKDFGPYAKDDLGDVPVNILYDMDTTGGNSGSPIMNARGELVGVNFDRAYDATINDFAWNESYSRSIGVDIRYVLWVADKVDGADFLLDEIGIKESIYN
ncbi:S46 family peptidase [Parapedobacter soli]|uniref:S46 family peptidase n=1 Tax=Parapedobacter soli TaxID=416955 RepID=UPI0036F1A12D